MSTVPSNTTPRLSAAPADRRWYAWSSPVGLGLGLVSMASVLVLLTIALGALSLIGS
jgi:hypothetical protein